jgi:hypothetical protein
LNGEERADKFVLWLLREIHERKTEGSTYVFLSNEIYGNEKNGNYSVPAMDIEALKNALRRFDAKFSLVSENGIAHRVSVSSFDRQKLKAASA